MANTSENCPACGQAPVHNGVKGPIPMHYVYGDDNTHECRMCGHQWVPAEEEEEETVQCEICSEDFSEKGGNMQYRGHTVCMKCLKKGLTDFDEDLEAFMDSLEETDEPSKPVTSKNPNDPEGYYPGVIDENGEVIAIAVHTLTGNNLRETENGWTWCPSGHFVEYASLKFVEYSHFFNGLDTFECPCGTKLARSGETVRRFTKPKTDAPSNPDPEEETDAPSKPEEEETVQCAPSTCEVCGAEVDPEVDQACSKCGELLPVNGTSHENDFDNLMEDDRAESSKSEQAMGHIMQGADRVVIIDEDGDGENDLVYTRSDIESKVVCNDCGWFMDYITVHAAGDSAHANAVGVHCPLCREVVDFNEELVLSVEVKHG